MGGSESKRLFHDPRNRVLYEAGLLTGPVWECVNLYAYDPEDPISSPGVLIHRYFGVELDRFNGSMTPFLPSPAEQDRTPPTRLAVHAWFPVGFTDDPVIGVALDEIPGGGKGKVAGPGCVVPVLIHSEGSFGPPWVDNGRYVICGDGADGGGITDTIFPGRTLGFVTSTEVFPNVPGFFEGHCGVLIHPM